MGSPGVETLTLTEWNATVSHTAEELRYTLRSRKTGLDVSGILSGILFLIGMFVLTPVIILIKMGQLLATNPVGPVWAVGLAWLFVGQLAVHSALVLPMLRSFWVWRRSRHDYVFTSDRVVVSEITGEWTLCSAGDLCGLRVSVYPVTWPGESLFEGPAADLIFLIGNQRQTFARYVGSPAADIRALAEHLHGRLAGYRSDYGLSPLEPLEVIVTTEADASALLLRNPHPGLSAAPGDFWRGCRRSGLLSFLTYPWVVTAWSAVGFAGTVGAHQLLVQNTDQPYTTSGGLFFFLLLAAVWLHRSRQVAAQPPQDRPAP